MFLKRLDIIGFKSFAERINIDFDKGITAVVGPNGSGKSNITDAIRWVLGEQSAKSLRGGKMEDVIFSGSDSREPLNFAEVTLTLENDDHFLPIDYSEVSVTRRVYRTGESDFFINKQACRLKDIVELFMDSGLGRESFSIISQGKVEQILNSKAEERRTIFEEAAGVLKYKNRKRQAEVKLEETEDNLNRVNDIIHELEGQIEPLKEQAEVAKDYLEKQAELEEVEVALTVVEIEQLHEAWQQLSADLNEQIDKEVELTTSIQGQEAKLTSLNEEMVKLDEEINNLQTELLRVTEQLEKLSGKKNLLIERNKHSSENKEQLIHSVEELSQLISNLQAEEASLKEQADQLEIEVSSMNEQIEENERQLFKLSENINEKIDDLKNDYFEKLSRKANANNEITHLQQRIEQLQSQKSKSSEKNKDNLNEGQKITNLKNEVENKLAKVMQELDDAINLFRQEEELLKKLQSKRDVEVKQFNELNDLLRKLKSRHQALEEMEDDLTGFFYGVKQVLLARDNKLKGIYGAVAELIDLPAQYETAIEIALGSGMQQIIVEDECAAREAINYLKNNRYGRATFLPLSTIKARQIPNNQLQAITGNLSFIGLASDLIKYDSKFSKVISNLLGTVIVTKDLQAANEFARLLQYRYRIVTLDGNVVHPGGSMTGGSVKQNKTSLLSRKTELKELEDQIAELTSKVAAAKENLDDREKKINLQQSKLEQVRKEGEQLRVDEQVIKGELREVTLSERNINERLALFDYDKEQLSSEINKLEDRITVLLQNINQIEAEIVIIDEKIANLTAQKNNEEDRREAITKDNNELKINFNLKKQSLTNILTNLESVSETILRNEAKLLEDRNELKLLTDRIKDNVSGEDFLKVEIDKKEEEKETIITTIASKRQERFNCKQEVDDLALQINSLRKEQKQFSNLIKDKEVNITRLDLELDNKLAHLREQYSLTFEGAKQQYNLAVSQDEARQKVKLIKSSIERLGVVNLGAIDEYERINKRYQFLQEQQTDLLEAMETLFNIISEMDEEMKKRFAETFSEVKQHFEPVFKSLFGGGRADLILNDPDDMLHTGVDIVAQPPGKRLQNLALLSGGERALTAIALLFAILKVRPVPFCVLDEVEAALDEANVHRFSNYLRKFSEETQFIVITHRKGTMEGADILYGITMQESGVSKLVSVRLEDAEQLA